MTYIIIFTSKLPKEIETDQAVITETYKADMHNAKIK